MNDIVPAQDADLGDKRVASIDLITSDKVKARITRAPQGYDYLVKNGPSRSYRGYLMQKDGMVFQYKGGLAAEKTADIYTYVVKSQTSSDVYGVNWFGSVSSSTCSCPDKVKGLICKHIWAVYFDRRLFPKTKREMLRKPFSDKEKNYLFKKEMKLSQMWMDQRKIKHAATVSTLTNAEIKIRIMPHDKAKKKYKKKIALNK